jgi:acylphosphatase
MKKVKIKLGPDGSVQVEAEGFKGGTCEQATAFLEKLFGNPETKVLKSSYYEQEETDEVKLQDGLPSNWCG